MYSRSYYPTDQAITIPDNYDGTAFTESQEKPTPTRVTPIKPDTPKRDTLQEREIRECINDSQDNAVEVSCDEEKNSSFLSRLLPFGFDFDIKKFASDISAEDILIVGLAIFLFISQDGDKMCSLILLSLIFIK